MVVGLEGRQCPHPYRRSQQTTSAFYKAVELTRCNWTLLQKLGTLFLTLGEFFPYDVHVATQML